MLAFQGKGANTPFILESRGLQRSETMSSLLERNPDIKDLMNQGELVPDTMVHSPRTFLAFLESCRWYAMNGQLLSDAGTLASAGSQDYAIDC